MKRVTLTFNLKETVLLLFPPLQLYSKGTTKGKKGKLFRKANMKYIMTVNYFTLLSHRGV